MKTPPKTIRVTVPVEPHVLAKFQRFAEASGLSIGKSMGDWLKDTVDGLEAMTDILEAHKRSPKQAMAKLTNYASALQDITEQALEGMKKPPKSSAEGPQLGTQQIAEAAFRAAGSHIPPSSNTGGKGTKNNSKLPSPAKALITKTRKTRNLTPLPKGPVGPAKVQAYADNNGVPPGTKSRS